MAERRESDTGVITRTKPEHQTQKPPLYKVLMHNDDYTTRDFVVEMLRTVFHHPEPEANRIMLHVHQTGVGVAGVYSYEVAEMKVRTVEMHAHEHEFPLMLTIEPEE